MTKNKQKYVKDYLEKAFAQEGINKCWNMPVEEFVDVLSEDIVNNEPYKRDVPLKCVINNQYGGFGLSEKAMAYLKDRGYTIEQIMDFGSCDVCNRCNSDLVGAIEALGRNASGSCAHLIVIEVPYPPELLQVQEFDGMECIELKTETFD